MNWIVTPDLLIAIEVSVRMADLTYTLNVGVLNERIVGHFISDIFVYDLAT